MRIGYGVSNVGYSANYVVYRSCYDLVTPVNPAGAGSVAADPPPNCGGVGYEPDTVVELTAQANPGWQFLAWTGDAWGSNNPIDVTMGADKTIRALFICDDCAVETDVPLAMHGSSGAPGGWTTILSEGFEGSYPGPWEVADNQSGYGDYHWGKRNCLAFQGSYSGWAVGGGVDGSSLACGSDYPNYADSWMIYGPFSLQGATAADLQFKQWVNSEGGHDGVCRLASTDGTYFYGSCSSGYSAGWVNAVLDLSNVYQIGNLLGVPEVWIAVEFVSDDTVNYPEGAYVDDLVLRKYVSLSGQPPTGAESTGTSACCTETTEQYVARIKRP
jgi:hypothetical protein